MGDEVIAVPEEIKEKAVRMGWSPKEEFKGDSEKWIEADKFVERGETVLPILKKQLEKYDGTIKGLNTTIASMRETFGEYQERQRGLEERAYKKALKDLTEQQKVAVKSGNLEEFEALEKEKQDLTPPAPPPTVREESAAKKEFDEWLTENSWYKDDKKLQSYAASISKGVMENEGLPDGRELYESVKAKVAVLFPDHPAFKQVVKPNVVVGSGDPPPVKGKRTFADLPADAQAQCKRFIKTIPNFTEKEYLKDYEWEN